MNEDEKKELIEYEKEIREAFERDLEVFLVEVREDIEETKKQDLKCMTDEAQIIADTYRISMSQKIIDTENAELERFQRELSEYYSLKFEEAKKVKHCHAYSCNNYPKTRCCFFAYYCSLKCQQADWKEHSAICNHDAMNKAIAEEPQNETESMEDTNTFETKPEVDIPEMPLDVC